MLFNRSVILSCPDQCAPLILKSLCLHRDTTKKVLFRKHFAEWENVFIFWTASYCPIALKMDLHAQQRLKPFNLCNVLPLFGLNRRLSFMNLLTDKMSPEWFHNIQLFKFQNKTDLWFCNSFFPMNRLVSKI